MTKLYGQLFINKHGVEVNEVWFEALCDLTPKALEKGVERLRNLSQGDKFCEFPPNCMQFRALCLDFYNDLQLPKASDAYREIITEARKSEPKWSHEVIRFTALKLTPEFWKEANEGITYPIFKKVYESVCHLLKQGHELPIVTGFVKRRAPSNLMVAKAHLSQMRQILGEAS